MQDKHENDNLKGPKAEACSSIEQTNACTKTAEIALKLRGYAFCFLYRDEMKTDSIVRSELCEKRKIGGYDVRDPRISASRLMICHQYDQLAVGKELDRPEGDSRRNHFLPV